MHLIVDGQNLLYRAYHTTGNLTMPDGRPCGAAWGLLRILFKCARTVDSWAEHDQHVDRLTVCWDGGVSARRRELFPDYKAHRKADWTSEERHVFFEQLSAQRVMVEELLLVLGADSVFAPGVEADDAIAVLAILEEADGTEVVILSGDSDFEQLDGLHILHPEWTAPRPSAGHWSLMRKAMQGDASDNVPGVRGIGPKKASDLVRACQAAKLPCEPGSLGALLRDHGHKLGKVLRRAAADCSSAEGLKAVRLAWQLVDLRCALQWPEVIAAVADAKQGHFQPGAFARECRARGWNGLEPFFASAERLGRNLA